MVKIREEYFGFMPGKLITDAIFAFKDFGRKVQRETERAALHLYWTWRRHMIGF